MTTYIPTDVASVVTRSIRSINIAIDWAEQEGDVQEAVALLNLVLTDLEPLATPPEKRVPALAGSKGTRDELTCPV